MKVSISTPTKDRRAWLPGCIQSVQQQTSDRWQHVIYDVSQPPIRDLIPDDRRYRYASGTSQGPAADFNSALSMADGDIICCLSDDDRLAPETVETVLREIGDRPWLLARTVIRHQNGDIICYRGGDQASIDATVSGSYMLGGAIFFRKGFLEQVGMLNPAYDGAADFDWYKRFIRAAQPAIIPDVLYLYTEHPDTDSNINAQRQQEQSQRIAREP